jgi:hypothetical protein
MKCFEKKIFKMKLCDDIELEVLVSENEVKNTIYYFSTQKLIVWFLILKKKKLILKQKVERLE